MPYRNKGSFCRPLLALLVVLCQSASSAQAQEQTPPIAPKLQETPLPPPVALPPPPTRPTDVPNRPLTADEAARIALRNQPDILVARAGVAAAQGRAQQTRAGLFPTLGIGASYTRGNTLSRVGSGNNNIGGVIGGGLFGTSTGFQTSVNLRQLLFDFGLTRNLTRQAQATERAAGANLMRVQADFVLLVKQAFYTYAQNNRLVEVNESNVRNQQAHLALAQARLKTGLGLPSDVVRAQTAVSSAIYSLNLARNEAALSGVNLALLMGVDPRTPLQTADSREAATEPRADDLNALIATATRQRPEALQAKANLEAAEHGVNAAKATNAPSLSANLGMSARDTALPPRNSSLSIGVSVQWNPFDGGLTAGRAREARALVESAQAQLKSAQLLITSDVSQAYLNLKTAMQGVVTAEAETANAQESLRLAEGRYRSGIGTFIEVTDAQAALLNASANRVNAQAAVEQARAALSRAIGASLPP